MLELAQKKRTFVFKEPIALFARYQQIPFAMAEKINRQITMPVAPFIQEERGSEDKE